MKEKLESYRANIRRQNLENVFARKRILLLEEKDRRDKEITKMQEELNLISPILSDLKQAAMLSQSEPGIRILRTANYQSLLLPFLSQDKSDDQQFYASYIACNLYFIGDSIPTPQLTEALIVLIQEASVRVRENCLSFLENTLLDFPDWREDLIKRKGLSDILRLLFMIPKVTKSYLLSLMSVIYRVLIRSQPNPSFSPLRKPLCQIALNAPPQDSDLIKRALLCLVQMLQLFPEETEKFLNQCRLIIRLCGVGLEIRDSGVILLTLQLIRGSLESMDNETFMNRVMPFLRNLEATRYDLGENNQNKQSLSARKLQLIVYEIIYQALQMGLLPVAAFSVDPIAASMLNVYESTNDESLVHPLAYCFAIVLTQDSNKTPMKERIAHQLHRTRQQFSHNFELTAFLHQVESYSPTFQI